MVSNICQIKSRFRSISELGEPLALNGVSSPWANRSEFRSKRLLNSL
jgi:hypothetical protein